MPAIPVPADRDGAIVLRVLKGETLQQVAQDYGLTRQRVSQIMRARCPGWDGSVRRMWGRTAAPPAEVSEPASRGRPRTWTDDMVLAALREASGVGVVAPTAAWWRSKGLSPSVGVIEARFGSWAEACEAAGLEVDGACRRVRDRPEFHP